MSQLYTGPNQFVHLCDLLEDRNPLNLFVIADENSAQHIPRKILDQIGIPWCSHLIPAGEEAKNLDQAAKCWEAMILSGANRRSIVVAVGGGVVTDLAGYVAANYMRGIAHINCPTTLLGMVDAAIGGKTGVNLPEGKNLIGSFHFPVAVISSIETLETLPKREFNAGMAEVIKTAYIGDRGLLMRIVAGGVGLEEMILACQRIKEEVVRKDPYDREGERKKLNFGHTIGHAIEAASRYRYLHGEAVAIGMVMELEMESELGFVFKTLGREPEVGDVEMMKGILKKYELPVGVEGLNFEDLKPYIKRDKKEIVIVTCDNAF